METARRKAPLIVCILLVIIFIQIKPLSSFADESIGQCSITIHSIQNSNGNHASASGDCSGHVQGYYSGGSSRIVIDGVDLGPMGSGTTLHIPQEQHGNYNLIINTVYEDPKPDPKPEKTPEPKSEPKPEKKPEVKPPAKKTEPARVPKEKEEVSGLTRSEKAVESNLKSEEEIQIEDKPDESLVEEKEIASEEEPVQEIDEQVTYSIEELTQMMQQGKIKGEVIKDKYFVIFEDGKENQEVTEEEAIKLGIIEDNQEDEIEEDSLVVEENIITEQEKLATTTKDESRKMPFIISAVGVIVILIGIFMYFIQWRKKS